MPTVAGGSASLEAAVSSNANTARTDPTATASPGWPFRRTTRPLTGDDTSTTALSVASSAKGASSCTQSPTATFQATTSELTVPSPRSGTLNSK